MVQEGESAIHIHIPPFFGFPSHSGHHSESSRVSWAIQYSPVYSQVLSILYIVWTVCFLGYTVYSLVLSILYIVWTVYMCQSQPPSTSHPTFPLMVLRMTGQKFVRCISTGFVGSFFSLTMPAGEFCGQGKNSTEVHAINTTHQLWCWLWSWSDGRVCQTSLR